MHEEMDGRSARFASLLAPCALRLKWLLRLMAGDTDRRLRDEDDLFQDVIARAWSIFDRFRDDGVAFYPWIVAIARNVVRELRAHDHRGGRDILFRSESPAPSNSDSFRDLPAAIQISVTSIVRRRDDMEKLESAVQSLVERDQMLLRLHFAEGLSFREIAEITGVALGTVHNEISRVLAKIRAVMT